MDQCDDFLQNYRIYLLFFLTLSKRFILKNIFYHPIFIFFIWPILFFPLILITGYDIFYNNHFNKNIRRNLFTLSFGTLFYLAVGIGLFFLSSKK
jgi:hypothetical protein